MEILHANKTWERDNENFLRWNQIRRQRQRREKLENGTKKKRDEIFLSYRVFFYIYIFLFESLTQLMNEASETDIYCIL